MTSLSRLAELHVRQFAAQQKRQDEINQRIEWPGPNRHASRGQSADRWRQAAINSAGPLCLLDAIGQAEESLLELFEQAPRCELPASRAEAGWGGAPLEPRWA
jgi:hypothetical protein